MSPALRAIADLDPRTFYFLPLGIGNAFTRSHFNSSLLLALGGRTVLVDAPAPLRRVLADAEKKSGIALDLDVVDSLFLTHLHADHCNGIEEFAYWRMFFANHLPKPTIAVHAEQRDLLWNNRLSAGMGKLEHDGRCNTTQFDDFFDVMQYRERQSISLGVEGLELEPIMVHHLIPTAGFKARFAGRTLGYSSDTGFFPELFDFFADCDTIIHEVGLGKGHTPLEDLLTLPESVRKKMYLTHVRDDFDIKNSPIPVLQEGRLYEV